MKKITALILAALMLLTAACAFADAALEYDAMVEFDAEHNCVVYRIPKEWEIKSLNEDILDELTSGEEDETTFTKAYSPADEEAEGMAEIRFGADPEQEDGTASTLFQVSKGGKLEYLSLILHNEKENNPYVSIGEDGKTLTVKLEGNPTTGYEWNMIPDNSGTYELLSQDYAVDDGEPGLVGAGGVYTFVIGISENPVGKDGNVIFTYARSFEENSTVQEMTLSLHLDDNKTVTALESNMIIIHSTGK